MQSLWSENRFDLRDCILPTGRRPAIFELAARALAEGNSIRATGRIVQVDKDTVCDWLNRSAYQRRLVMLYFWRRLHLTECQLDELWSFVHTKEAHLPLAKLIDETYGDATRIDALLKASPVSATINTSFVERDNLSCRKHNRRLTRKTTGFSKDLSWFEKQLWLSFAYYHFCLPHQSLRRPLDEPEPTGGAGSPRKWQPVTPAMEAGLTDHVWTTEELLSFRAPVEFLDQLDELAKIFPDPNKSSNKNGPSPNG